MSPRLNTRNSRIVLLTLLVIVAAGLSGCKKMRANMKISKYDKLVEKAAPYFPGDHPPVQALQQNAKAAFDEGKSKFDAGDFDTALIKLTDAVNLQQQVCEDARRAQAEKLFQLATVEKGIADGNTASEQDPTAYSLLVQLYQQTQQDRTDEKWDKVIESSTKIVADVEAILNPLRQQASSEIETAKQAQLDMLAQEAEKHAPTHVLDVARLIKQAEVEFSDPVRKYHQSKARSKSAQERANQGIIETNKQKSLIKIAEIEKVLTIAESLLSKKWVPDAWTTNQEIYLELLGEHDGGVKEPPLYTKALGTAERLLPKVDTMVVETRRLRALDAIERLEKDLATLIAEKAKLYLEEAVVQVEQIRDTAKSLHTQGQGPGKDDASIYYPQVETTCEKGIEAVKTIYIRYNTYAEGEIKNATSSYLVAKDVFTKMQNVFIIKPNEYVKKIDLEFENNKKALFENLRSTLVTIDNQLKAAEKKRLEQKAYHEAIQSAREQANRANQVRAGTYNVVAHNAINEVADWLSRWERDGGREWATAEVDDCKKALDAAIQLRGLNKYEQAIEQAAEARWKLDFAIQVIEQKANKEIALAQAAIEQAKAQEAMSYQAEAYDNAEKLLKIAQQELGKEHLKQSTLSAMEAQTIAKRAESESVRLWTSEEINKAEGEVRKAEQSGSAAYAEDRLDRAQDLLAVSQKLEAAKQYPSARETATQAANEAVNARNAKINATDEWINTVRKYDGWKYAYETLSQAIVKNKQARRLMDQGQYDQANALATESLEIAKGVLDVSKLQAFDNQLVLTKQTLNDVLLSGAKFFQTDELRRMLTETERIEKEFTIETFDDIMQETNRLNKNLKLMLENTKKIITTTVTVNNQRIADIEKSDRAVYFKTDLEKAKRHLSIAQRDFEKDNYLISYQSLRQANRIIVQLETLLGHDAYAAQVRELLVEYNDAIAKFHTILRMDPKTLIAFSRGPDGRPRFVALAARFTPFQFRRSIDDLLRRADALTPPDDMKLIQRELIYIMENSGQAAKLFEQLQVLDRYDARTVEKIIKQAYDIMATVRTHQRELDKRLMHEDIVIGRNGA